MEKEIIPLDQFRRVIHPMPTFIVTVADKKGHANPFTVDWLTPVSNDPPLLVMAVARERHSYKALQENPCFIINVVPYDQAAPLMICGRHSGKKEDKFKSAGYTPIAGHKVNVPAIAEAIAIVECEVEAEYPAGDHVLFMARVVYAECNQGVLVQGLRDLKTAPPIFHTGAGHLTGCNGEDLFIPSSIKED